jgi:hypothetical protein
MIELLIFFIVLLVLIMMLMTEKKNRDDEDRGERALAFFQKYGRLPESSKYREDKFGKKTPKRKTLNRKSKKKNFMGDKTALIRNVVTNSPFKKEINYVTNSPSTKEIEYLINKLNDYLINVLHKCDEDLQVKLINIFNKVRFNKFNVSNIPYVLDFLPNVSNKKQLLLSCLKTIKTEIDIPKDIDQSISELFDL